MASDQRTQRRDEEAAQRPDIQTSINNEVSTLGELFNALSEDFSYLIRKEVELARTETMEKVSKATRSVTLMVAAGLVGYAGFIAILIVIADLINAAIGVYWISWLIVGVAVLIAAAILYFAGRSALSNLTLTPEKTVETLRNDARWAKEQVQ
ncbi:MAG: phage holin family protein [Caldilineaceae bacterium]